MRANQYSLRFPELDFIRAIAVLGVIAIHISVEIMRKSPMETGSFIFASFMNQWGRFCVPVFLLVSGILAYHSFRKGIYINILKKRVVDLIIPYLTWSVIGIFFLTSLTYKSIIMTFVFGTGSFYQLYYIPLLFQLYLLVPILNKILFNARRVILVGIFTLFGFLLYELLITTGKLSGDKLGYTTLALQVSFLGWLVYFAAGLLIAKHFEKFKGFVCSQSIQKLIFIYCISLILIVLDYYLNANRLGISKMGAITAYSRPVVMFYSFSTILLMFKLGLTIRSSFLTKLYENSFGIYLSHMLIISILRAISYHYFFSNAIFGMISFGITLALAYLITEGLKKSPLSLVFLGQRRNTSSSKTAA